MNEILEKSNIELPKGFTVRGAELNDVDEALKLFNAWSQAVIKENDINDVNVLRDDWNTPKFDPARDIRLVFSPEGMLVGYVEVWTLSEKPVHPNLWGRVHPDYSGLGIGTWLLQWAEERACKVLDKLPADLRFAPRIGVPRPAVESRKFFEEMGYTHIRSFYDMLIDMDSMPPAPEWSEGITLRTGENADMKDIYLAFNESFRDHYGHVEEPIEKGFPRFKHFLESDGMDPSMWFLAMDGNEIAGLSLCRPESYHIPDAGYVNILGVRRPWRKLGLGLALLRHSFGEFYKLGKRKVMLGVDAGSLTGALRLYEKAGMHVHQAFDLFEKTVRSGREISVESLSE
ncbi:MAG: GNAT family N-acetyltransferase [Chloroflexi bacterium]|nr:GNAT family N-acetyltransferase [Chloroflexota bacterium]